MPREKIKFALRMSPETQRLVKEMYPRDNCRTQNEFIEKAIRFYSGCVSGQDACEFLPAALTDALRSTVHDSEGRVCRLLFKLAVELDTPATSGSPLSLCAGRTPPAWATTAPPAGRTCSPATLRKLQRR